MLPLIGQTSVTLPGLDKLPCFKKNFHALKQKLPCFSFRSFQGLGKSTIIFCFSFPLSALESQQGLHSPHLLFLYVPVCISQQPVHTPRVSASRYPLYSPSPFTATCTRRLFTAMCTCHLPPLTTTCRYTLFLCTTQAPAVFLPPHTHV